MAGCRHRAARPFPSAHSSISAPYWNRQVGERRSLARPRKCRTELSSRCFTGCSPRGTSFARRVPSICGRPVKTKFALVKSNESTRNQTEIQPPTKCPANQSPPEPNPMKINSISNENQSTGATRCFTPSSGRPHTSRPKQSKPSEVFQKRLKKHPRCQMFHVLITSGRNSQSNPSFAFHQLEIHGHHFYKQPIRCFQTRSSFTFNIQTVNRGESQLWKSTFGN